MARRKTDVMKWMDEALRADPDLAKAVEERLDEMRRELDEVERPRNTPPRTRVGRRVQR